MVRRKEGKFRVTGRDGVQRFFDMKPKDLYDKKDGFVLSNAGSRFRGKGPYQSGLCRLFARSRVSVEGFGTDEFDDEI